MSICVWVLGVWLFNESQRPVSQEHDNRRNDQAWFVFYRIVSLV